MPTVADLAMSSLDGVARGMKLRIHQQGAMTASLVEQNFSVRLLFGLVLVQETSLRLRFTRRSCL